MLRLRGEILRPDGSEVLSEDRSAPVAETAKLGADMARDLRARAGEGFFDWITAKA
jgi:hydroxymethylbilane synthase